MDAKGDRPKDSGTSIQPVEPMRYVQGRLLDLAHRLAAAAPEDHQRRAVESIISESYRKLLGLSEPDPKAEDAAARLLLGLRSVIDAAAGLTEHVAAAPPRMVLAEQLFTLPTLAALTPLAITGSPPPGEPPWWYWELDADTVKRLFEQLLAILRDIERQLEDPTLRDEIRAMIAALEAYIATLVGGAKVYFHVLWDWLTRRFLPRLSPILRALGRTGVRLAVSIASAIWAWLESLGISWGAEFGAEVAGGEAVAIGAGFIAAFLAALIGGHLIGKWIGKLEYDGKTVSDWLSDGIYLYYFDDPQDCQDLWAEYVRARNVRVAYEPPAQPWTNQSRHLCLRERCVFCASISRHSVRIMAEPFGENSWRWKHDYRG